MPGCIESVSSIRILYIDDEPALLELGKIFLEKSADIIVDVCSEPLESLKKLSVVDYDVIISDYQMPIMDGIQLLKAVRASGNQTPFIIFTGKGREDVAIDALNNGADFYLQKGGKPSVQFAELENMIRHLSSRSEMNYELKASEAKYKSLFENAADAIIIMDENKYLECNRGCELLFKYPREKFILLSPIELSPPLQPDGRESRIAAKKFIDLALTGRRQVFEWVHLDSDKHPFIADVSLNRVLINGNYRLHCIIRDKTKQRSLEKKFLDSESRYHRLTENAVDLIYRLELVPEKRFSYVSPSALKMTGYTPEEHYADPDLGMKIILPEDRSKLQHLTDGKDVSKPILMRWMKKDGEVIWTEQRNVPVYDYKCNLVAMEGIARDVTENKLLQIKLEEVNRKLTLLFNLIRPDIIDKLAALQTCFDKCSTLDCEEREVYVANVSKIVSDVNQIIAFTRYYEHIGEQKPYWQNLSKIIEENCDGKLPLKVQEQDYELYADELLGKVFSSLMDNSLHHAVNASVINVQFEEKDGKLLVSWSDNGPGVATDLKESIFDHGVGHNNGYGLFLSREILSITGMSINEAGTPGEGARFIITVPKGHFRSLKQ